MSKPIRYTVLLTAHTDRILKTLEQGFNRNNRADVIDLAITLLEWAYKEKCAGRSVGSMDDSNQLFRELLFPSYQVVTATTDVDQVPDKIENNVKQLSRKPKVPVTTT